MSKRYDQCKASIKRYMQKLENITFRVPKGRKAEIEAYAAAAGKSVNGLITDLLRQEMGMTEEEWKKPPAEEAETEEPFTLLLAGQNT